MRRILCALWAAVLLLTPMGCAPRAPESAEQPEAREQSARTEQDGSDERRRLSVGLLRSLSEGKYGDVERMFDAKMKAALPEARLKDAWEQSKAMFADGAYLGAKLQSEGSLQGYQIVELMAEFETGAVKTRVTFSAGNKVSGLFFQAGEKLTEQAYLPEDAASGTPAPDAAGETQDPAPEAPPAKAETPPQGVEERMVSIESQPGFPLKATLTVFAGANGGPSAVLVPGSGPNDQDESIGPNKPFRDLAWQLAARGITTLRYDKITHAYPAELAAAPDAAEFDIEKETVLDAIAAVRWLQRQPEVDADRVYILGHSLGAIVAPDVDRLGADAKGFILLGGTPLQLWEIMYAQNQAVLEKMKAEGKDIKKDAETVEAEKRKAEKLGELTDEQARSSTAFGTPAWYMRSLTRLQGVEWLKQVKKPTLVIQGGRDFQIPPEHGVQAYKSAFGDAPYVTYKTFDDLSHIFGKYSGEGEGTAYEYGQSQPLDERVGDAVAEWMKNIP